MTVTTPDRLGEVLAFLAASDLPTSDLTDADPGDFRVIERDGRIVGCVAVEAYGDAGLLRSLAVAEDLRGEGLGGQLVEEAEALARERRLGALYLLTTTAAPFFETRGYAPVDRAAVPEAVRRSAEFCSVCPASAACLGKALSP